MEQLLWSFEDLRQLTTHGDAPVRRWALERLIQRYPNQAGEVLVTMLDDQGTLIASKAYEFLAKTGESDKYGPLLLEELNKGTTSNLASLVRALAQLNYRPALPKLIELAQASQTLNSNEAISVILALGEFEGDDVRKVLWNLLEKEAELKGRYIVPLMDALLEIAQPEDIERLVNFYRPLPLEKRPRGPFGMQRQPISAFAASVGLFSMVNAMERRIRQGFWPIMEVADLELGAEVELSEEGWRDLEKAFQRFSDVYDVLLREAKRTIEERGYDLAGWQATWAASERPVGFRQRALYSMSILEAFAKQPMTTLTRRQQESVLGTALLSYLCVAVDYQARLDDTQDRTETLLEILAEHQKDVLPNVVSLVADLGPDIVPRLLDVLAEDDGGWATIRAAEALEKIAQAHPGSCDGAIPQLIDCVHHEQGDILLEAVSDTLKAIGPTVVAPINNKLQNKPDQTQEIFLVGVLSEMAVESAATVILAHLEAGKQIKEPELLALADIGSSIAIEPLYQLWNDNDDVILAEQLLILCEVNGVEKPELPTWRQLVEAQDKKLDNMLNEDMDKMFDRKNFMAQMQKLAASPPKPRSWGGAPEAAAVSSDPDNKANKQRRSNRSNKKKKRRR